MTLRSPNRYQRPDIASQAVFGHTSSFALPQQQNLPPGRGMTQQDLPPRAAPRAVTLLTHTNSFQLPLQQVLPPGKSERTQLPPISQRRNLADWQDYILPWAQGPPSRPLNQTDWPNPRASRPLVQDWTESGNAILPAAPAQKPFAQADWPVPPAPARVIALGHADSFKLPLQQVIQPNQYNWPNPPIAARRVVADWLQALPLLQPSANMPCMVTSWFNPWGPRPLVQGWIVATNLALTTVVVSKPFFQADWPNPRGKPFVVTDWLQQALPLQPVTQLPFRQTDWPVPPKVKVGVLQTWSDSFKLTLQQTLPPRQLDWPVPRGRVSYDLRGFAQRNLAVASVQPKPLNQYDWPNPRGPSQPVITTREFTHNVVPPVPPVFDSDLTLKNEIVRLRYLDHASGRVRFLKNEVRS